MENPQHVAQLGDPLSGGQNLGHQPPNIISWLKRVASLFKEEKEEVEKEKENSTVLCSYRTDGKITRPKDFLLKVLQLSCQKVVNGHSPSGWMTAKIFNPYIILKRVLTSSSKMIMLQFQHFIA